MSALKAGVDQVSGISQAAFENKDMDFDKFLLEYRGQKTSGDKGGMPTHYLELMIYLHQKPSDHQSDLNSPHMVNSKTWNNFEMVNLKTLDNFKFPYDECRRL